MSSIQTYIIDGQRYARIDGELVPMVGGAKTPAPKTAPAKIQNGEVMVHAAVIPASDASLGERFLMWLATLGRPTYGYLRDNVSTAVPGLGDGKFRALMSVLANRQGHHKFITKTPYGHATGHYYVELGPAGRKLVAHLNGEKVSNVPRIVYHKKQRAPAHEPNGVSSLWLANKLAQSNGMTHAELVEFANAEGRKGSGIHFTLSRMIDKGEVDCDGEHYRLTGKSVAA